MIFIVYKKGDQCHPFVILMRITFCYLSKGEVALLTIGSHDIYQ